MYGSYVIKGGFCRRNRFPAAESEFVSLFEKATRSERGSDTDARLKVPRGMTDPLSERALQAAARDGAATSHRPTPRAGGLMPPWPT